MLARPYGGHTDTATLALPQLAVWIMAELATRAIDTDCGLPPQLRFAALVNPTRQEIRFTAFGLRDTDQITNATAPTSEVIPHLAHPLIQSHTHTSTDGTGRQRFRFDVVVPGERRQDQERGQGRGPGTVTVIDTSNPVWWTDQPEQPTHTSERTMS
jgi:hypothetical protein